MKDHLWPGVSLGLKLRTCFSLWIVLNGLIGVLLFQKPVFAQSYLGKSIESIEFQGNQKIEKEALERKVSLKPGDRIDADLVRQSIESLYEMGYFNQIRVSWDQNRKALIFKIKERPVVQRILFSGNDEVEEDDLKEVISTEQYSILNIYQIQKDMKALREFYEGKGFYLAQIDYSLKELPRKPKEPEGVLLTFEISELQQVKVQRVFFLGNEKFEDEELERVFKTREESFMSFLSGSGNFKEQDFKDDLQRLQLFYLSKGYVRAKVQEPIVHLSEDKKWIDLTIRLEEGERYKVGDVDFAGDLLFTKEELQEGLSLQEDEWFSNLKLREDIQLLTEKYQDKGYAFTNVVPKSAIQDSERRVNLAYEIDKGRKVYFGDIKIQGNTKTKDKVIRRELEIFEGELFSGTGLRESRQNVERLGFFKPGSVRINYQPSEKNPQVVNVTIRVEERQTGQLTLGAGYSSVQKTFFTLQVSQNNFLGNGQELRARAQLSDERKTYSLLFMEPYFMDTEWTAGASLFRLNNTIVRSHSYRTAGFDLRTGHPLWDKTRLFVTYKYDETDIDQILDEEILVDQIESETGKNEVDAKEQLKEELGQGVLSSVRAQVVRDNRNNRFEPTSGDYESVSMEFAGIGGDKNFIKTELDLRYYKELSDNGWTFRTRLKMGGVSGISDDVPVDERFFLGGPSSLRGYREYSIGPQATHINDDGEEVFRPLGGRYSLFSNLELEYPLIREAGIKWVLFYDIGNAWEDFPLNSSADSDSLLQNYGFGIRWFSPIGVLRFEFGYPVTNRDEPVSDESPNFTFMIGPPF
jgi:outer membrane protein insertion porin family